MSKLRQTKSQMEGTDEWMNKDVSNPLSKIGKKVLASMKGQYGTKKGKSVFYATMNKKGLRSKWEK